MASLQIRNLPSDLHETLSLKADREGRSLAQQALVELRKVPEHEAVSRRRRAIARLQEFAPLELTAPPEELIREDRDR